MHAPLRETPTRLSTFADPLRVWLKPAGGTWRNAARFPRLDAPPPTLASCPLDSVALAPSQFSAAAHDFPARRASTPTLGPSHLRNLLVFFPRITIRSDLTSNQSFLRRPRLRVRRKAAASGVALNRLISPLPSMSTHNSQTGANTTRYPALQPRQSRASS